MQLKYGPYSPSRLETALCGLAFHRTYVQPAGPRQAAESVPAARGSVVHEVFEWMTQEMINGVAAGQPATFTPAMKRVKIAEALARHPAAAQDLETVKRAVDLYDERRPKVLTSDAGVELRLAIRWDDEKKGFVECDYDDPAAFGRGRSDIFMVSDDLKVGLVYDHKTQPDITPADTFQMGFYAWVISKIHPYLEEIHTVLHFARHGVYSQPFVWTRELLAQIEDQVLTRIQFVEMRQSWEATPNQQCQYCPIVGECPVVKTDGPLPSVITSTHQAVEIFGELEVLEERTSRLKKALKAFVEAYGPVAIPGKIAEIRETEAINWDAVNKKFKERVMGIFQKHDVDPATFMAFGQEASRGVWLVANKALVEELSALLPRKVNTRFDGFKA